MKLEVKGFGKQYSFKQESDIIEVFHTESGLRVVVIASIDDFNQTYLEFLFRYSRGYRFLDEGDFIAYWESKMFDSNQHLYEILSGGWSNGEILESGIMSVSSSLGFREWFIVTTNGCMTVLSNDEPFIRELPK